MGTRNALRRSRFTPRTIGQGGRVTQIRVWAPLAERVRLRTADDTTDLAPGGGGWWDCPDLAPGTDYAFAVARMAAIAQFGDHDLGLGLGAAADRECAGDRPALGAHFKRQGHGHC